MVHAIVPRDGDELVGVELVYIFIKDIHVRATLPVQLVVFLVGTQQMVVQLELWSDVIRAVIVLGKVCRGHGVHIDALVILEHIGSRLQHGVITVGVGTCQRVLLIDAHVRHLLIGNGQQVVIVALGIGIGESEVGGNLDAVGDVVIECHTGSEAVLALLDDGTRLMVITAGDAESGLLSTASDAKEMVLTQTPLCDGIHPVGIIIILFVLRERRVVVQLSDV